MSCVSAGRGVAFFLQFAVLLAYVRKAYSVFMYMLVARRRGRNMKMTISYTENDTEFIHKSNIRVFVYRFVHNIFGMFS